jgi:maltose O-acetyltransferase
MASLRRRGAAIQNQVFIADAHIEGDLQLLTIGPESFIGRCNIQLHDRVMIGSCVCINDGVLIFTASHDVADKRWSGTSGPVIIEDFAWIASSAILLPGVRIGRGAVVGAGAVVSRDVPARAVAVGNPAKLLPDKRAIELAYSPISSLAGVRAWLSDDSKCSADDAQVME